MAEIVQRPKIELQVTLALNESECRAFDAMVGYGIDQFIKVFYEHLGKAYMEKHEGGLRSLFTCVSQVMPVAISRVDKARDVFNGRKDES